MGASSVLKYTLVVMTGPDNGMGHIRARGFAQALAQQGHRLQRVFFYGDGVRAAQEETPEWQQFWTTLAGSQGSELVLCSASAERYGLTEPVPPFTLMGLGTLMEAGFDSDRIISFD